MFKLIDDDLMETISGLPADELEPWANLGCALYTIRDYFDVCFKGHLQSLGTSTCMYKQLTACLSELVEYNHLLQRAMPCDRAGNYGSAHRAFTIMICNGLGRGLGIEKCRTFEAPLSLLLPLEQHLHDLMEEHEPYFHNLFEDNASSSWLSAVFHNFFAEHQFWSTYAMCCYNNDNELYIDAVRHAEDPAIARLLLLQALDMDLRLNRQITDSNPDFMYRVCEAAHAIFPNDTVLMGMACEYMQYCYLHAAEECKQTAAERLLRSYYDAGQPASTLPIEQLMQECFLGTSAMDPRAITLPHGLFHQPPVDTIIQLLHLIRTISCVTPGPTPPHIMHNRYQHFNTPHEIDHVSHTADPAAPHPANT